MLFKMFVNAGAYVENLVDQHKGKMTVEQLSVLLTARINEHAKHGTSLTFTHVTISSLYQLGQYWIVLTIHCEWHYDRIVLNFRYLILIIRKFVFEKKL